MDAVQRDTARTVIGSSGSGGYCVVDQLPDGVLVCDSAAHDTHADVDTAPTVARTVIDTHADVDTDCCTYRD
jgi:hypothetical protein|eukprot:COSAG01_NODE_1632_length_9668_cov_100.223952_1_plen_72_part_00